MKKATQIGAAQRYFDAMKEMHKSESFNIIEMAVAHSISRGIGSTLTKMGYVRKINSAKPWRHCWIGPDPSLAMARQTVKRETKRIRDMREAKESEQIQSDTVAEVPLFTNPELISKPAPDLSKFYYIAGKYEIPAARLNEFMNDLKAIL